MRNFIQKTIFLFSLFTIPLSVFGMSFSLQIIQRDTPGDAIFNSSFLVEQTVMDYFFDRGCIVSNNPIFISKNNSQDDSKHLSQSFLDAKEGCMDFIVNMSIYYDIAESTNPEAILLSNIKKIEWNAVALNTKEEIAKGLSIVPTVTRENNNSKGLITFVKSISKNISMEFSKKGGGR